MYDGLELQNAQFGVRFRKRGPDDKHIIIQLLGEDDGNWFAIGNGFSNFWLDDLIGVLQDAKILIERDGQPNKWGYEFRSE